MKMVKACLPTIRLRFGTKPTFDAFTDEQQYGAWGRSLAYRTS